MPKNPVSQGHPDHLRCTAKSQRTGNRCGALRMVGKTVCKNHGGHSTGPVNSHGLYRRHFSGDTLAVHDGADARDITPAYQAASAMLDRAIEMMNNPEIDEADRAKAMEVADRLLGRLGSLANTAIAQDAAKAAAAAPDATRQLIIAPPVAKSADEWAENYKPDAD